MAANYNQNFSAQSGVLQNLNNLLTPIAQAGPDQQGFGANELAALNTASGEGVGQNYAKASQALNNQLAAQGGGNDPNVKAGATGALKGSLAASAANQLSQQGLQITEANYAQGRNNWTQATNGLQTLAQQYNPNAIASNASNTLGSAFGEYNTIQQQKNQEQAEIAGGITSLAMDAATFGAGALAGGGGFNLGGGLKSLATGGKSLMPGNSGGSGSSGPYS